MITLSFNIANPADLDAILDKLDQRGLLSAPVAVSKPAVSAAPKPVSTGVRGNGGAWFKENAIRQQAYLDEKGFTSRPPATEHELTLRAKIDKTREKAGEKGINWKVDVISRDRVLMEEFNYDIFAQDGTQPAVTEPDEPLPTIDLDNSVA